MTETHEEPQPLQIMVFGAELKRVIAPAKKQSTRNYVLHFEPFDTPKRFADFDGVIVFQGTFEEVEVTRNWMGEEFIKHRFAKDELDKRIKELRLLFAKGGFACFVLCEPFIDDGGSRDLSQTDLVKYFLSVDGLYRYNFPSRVPHVRPMLSEFQPFLDLFGAANSWFAPGGQWNLKSIAIAEGKLAGMIFGPQIYCVPSQIPEATRDKIAEPNPRTKEFFELLTDGLVSVVRKQAVTIPEWADAYKFDKERGALARKETLTDEMSRVEAEIDSFRRYKWILINDGDDLVDAVKHVFETGFGFRVESVDEFREDLKLLGEDGKPFLFAEVKGTNRGVKRENVNQADSHRERAGLAPTFPSILIMNTSIKNARSLAEKDEPVASEQVEHAKRHNILILRTLDLLRLLALHSRGAITRAEVQRLLITGAGWLKVTDDERFELVES